MFRRKLAAALFAVVLGAGAGACGTDDTGDLDTDAGPGNSAEEDPTLDSPEGGEGSGDGGDEGTTPNSATDSGSGTGAGRGDG